MTVHWSILRVAGLATVCLALAAAPALAHDGQAGNSFNYVGTFSDSQPFSGEAVTDIACFDGQPGTASGIDSIVGRFNNAAPFFHFTAVESGTYRIDYPGGRYVLGGYRTKIEDEANNESGVIREHSIEVTQDRAAVYLAGQQIGTTTVRVSLHHAFVDGELKSSVDNVRVSCPSWSSSFPADAAARRRRPASCRDSADFVLAVPIAGSSMS